MFDAVRRLVDHKIAKAYVATRDALIKQVDERMQFYLGRFREGELSKLRFEAETQRRQIEYAERRLVALEANAGIEPPAPPASEEE